MTSLFNFPGLPRPHTTPLTAGVVFRPRKDDREVYSALKFFLLYDYSKINFTIRSDMSPITFINEALNGVEPVVSR